MPLLKVDFHTHTGEDPEDRDIAYSARELLDAAASYQFQAITIANHNALFYTDEVREHAARRGIVLIPGIEATVEGKHVLIVNYTGGRWPPSLKLGDLRAQVGDQALVVAPHPFYPRAYCLHDQLERHIDQFDAIEYAHLHFRFFNPNRRAVALAHRYHLPLIGTSDAHSLRQLNSTYSEVDAETVTIPDIIQAVRAHKVRVVTRPLSSGIFVRRSLSYLWGLLRK